MPDKPKGLLAESSINVSPSHDGPEKGGGAGPGGAGAADCMPKACSWCMRSDALKSEAACSPMTSTWIESIDFDSNSGTQKCREKLADAA